MDILTYVVEHALVFIPALLILGQIIKTIPNVPNWIIPFALLVPGVVGTMAIIGWTVEGAIQGVLVTGAAVYGNQMWKQGMEGKTTVGAQNITKDEDSM